MLPHRPGSFHLVALALLVPLLGVLGSAGCAPGESPEQQVRAVITQGEEAAEARDLSGIMEIVSERYADGEGVDREELKQYLRGYLVAHTSIRLLVRVDSIEFPYRDLAKARLTIGTMGREQDGATAFDLAADLYEVDAELTLEDGEWRVTRAEWRPSS